MIEINRTSNKPDNRNPVQRKKEKAADVRSLDFKVRLESAISFDFQGSIDELLNDLKDEEKRFLDNPSLSQMMRYKALVRRILKLALEQGASTAETRSSSWKGDKIYTVVNIIDQKLLELQKTLTSGSPAFSLMKTIEEVRGLLLDILS